MNTLNYIGCKNTLFPNILEVCQENIADLNECSFMDAFAGTGIVSHNIQQYVRRNSSNDLEYYSFIINKALLKCNYTDKLQYIINECNELPAVLNGLMYLNYSPSENCERMFFTSNNAQKCDAIRQYIQQLFNDSIINEFEFAFLLASLIVSVDKVANTSCVYGAYLKEYKKSALKPLILNPIHQDSNVKVDDNNVFNDDVANLTEMYHDIVYMDPPYNQRQYSGNYSPLNYLALYNENIVIKGKTGLIENYNKSKFSQKTNINEAFRKLTTFQCKYMILSYNNEGLMDFEKLKNMLLQVGNIKLYKINYKKFKAQKIIDGESVFEYLWFIDKSNVGGLFEIIEMN